MPNPNCTISFDAKRALVSGINVGDPISLKVELMKFDESFDVNKKTNTTYTGRETSALYYIASVWDVEFTPNGIVVLPNLSEVEMTTEYVNMFWRSVANSEEFVITTLDDNDSALVVKMKSNSPSKNRPSKSYVNKFNWSFQIRESI